MKHERVIHHDLYPREALAQARSAFRDYCTIRITPLPGNAAQIAIQVDERCGQNERDVVLEFLNYILDCAAELHLQRE